MSIVVVVGPQGCGKAKNVRALQAHYGCRLLLDGVDDWRQARPAPGTLILSNESPPAAWATMNRAIVIQHGDAMAAIARSVRGSSKRSRIGQQP